MVANFDHPRRPEVAAQHRRKTFGIAREARRRLRIDIEDLTLDRDATQQPVIEVVAPRGAAGIALRIRLQLRQRLRELAAVRDQQGMTAIPALQVQATVGQGLALQLLLGQLRPYPRYDLEYPLGLPVPVRWVRCPPGLPRCWLEQT